MSPAPTQKPTANAPERHDRLAHFSRGARLGLPIFLGYMPIGMAFGLAATAGGFTAWQAVACSGLVIAGAGQFIAVAALKTGAGILGALVATGIVNLRYVLFSATMTPHVRAEDPWAKLGLAFTLTDETFAINIADLREGTADRYSMLGVGAVSWVGWTLGTAIGALAGSAIGDPTAWGVQFAMPAMFTALLVGQLTGRREMLAALLAAVLALVLSAVLPGQWSVVAGAVAAATVMTAVAR
jgi:4-azaleucine resistance transporter AzlC